MEQSTELTTTEKAAQVAEQLEQLAPLIGYLIIHAEDKESMRLERAVKSISSASRGAMRSLGSDYGMD